jgi:EpsI family protein
MSSTAARAYLIAALMAMAAGLSWLFVPHLDAAPAGPSLSSIVPSAFGDWKELHTAVPLVDPRARPEGEPDLQNPYDDVLMRAYGNRRGDVVLLALAYGRNQQQEVKIHRPELCYVSQGFKLLTQARAKFPVPAAAQGRIDGRRMLVTTANRFEAVSYWIRIGDVFSSGAWSTRMHILSEGLNGRIVDGMLVRVSQVLPDAQSASPQRYRLQEQFVADLVNAVPPSHRHLLVGHAT